MSDSLQIPSLQDMSTAHARAYDLSRSEPDEICKLASQLIIGGLSLETVNELFLLAARQKPQKGRVDKIVQETFTQVLKCLRFVSYFVFENITLHLERNLHLRQ